MKIVPPITGGASCYDKQALAVDKTGIPSTNGNIYVTYTFFPNSASPTTQILLVRSIDGGNSWSAPIVVQDQEAGLTQQGSTPVVAPNGDLYVVWERGLLSGGPSIVVRKATTSGGVLQWGNRIIIANICSIATSPPPGYFRGKIAFNDFPQIAVDTAPGSPRNGWVYVTWHDCIATGNPTDPDIYVSKTTNQGGMWSAPVRVNTVTADRQFFPSMAVDAIGNLHFMYYNRNPLSGLTSTSYMRSTDGGVNFQALPDLSSQANNWEGTRNETDYVNYGDYIKMIAEGARIHTAWAQARFNYTGQARDPDMFYRGVRSPFKDNFEDATTGSYFFSNATTGTRWAVGQNVSGALCDLVVRSLPIPDQAAEVRFSGVAGQAGATYSLASYKGTYTPALQEQHVIIRVTTPDGTDLSNKKGRMLTGLIGQTTLSTPTCGATGLSYTQHSFTSSIFGGIELDTGKPFLQFDPLFTPVSFPAVSLAGVTRLTIDVYFTGGGMYLILTNSENDAVLFQNATAIPYPMGFNWSGTIRGAFIYYGIANNSGTLEVRDFTVDIP